MKPIKLEDLIPEEVDLKIGAKTYTLRKLNLQDEIWLNKTYGTKLEDIFGNVEFEFISKIIFRLLKDKTDFAAEELDEPQYDDDGNIISQTTKITGPEKIMRALSGVHEKQDAYFALMSTIGISRPVLDEMTEEELKRLNSENKKKVTAKKPVGEKSLTK
jgi:hypothetical protein